MPRLQAHLATLLLLAVGLVWLLAGAGNGSLANADDGITAAVIRGMSRGEHLFDFTWQGDVTHQRPLLFCWLSAAVAAVGGTSEWIMRLWPSLGVIGMALAATMMARRLGATAWLAIPAGALVLALHLPVASSRRVGEDALLSALLAFATLAFLDAKERPRRWLVWGALVGLAAMTKGVVALLAVVVVGLELLLRRRAALATRWPWLGGLVALAIAAPWHVVQTIRHGRAFWAKSLGEAVLQRASATSVGGDGPLFHVEALFVNDPVLASMLVGGLAITGVALAHGRLAREAAWSIGLAALVPLVLFSLAPTGLPHEVLPAYAPMCALAAAGLAAWVSRPLVGGTLATSLLLIAAPLRAEVLLAPDLAPDTKLLALEAAERLGPGDTYYAIDHYYTGSAYYSERFTMQLTTDEAFLAQVGGRPSLRRSGQVRLVEGREVAELAASGRPICGVTPASQREALVTLWQSRRRPGTLMEVVALPDLVLVCLTPLPRRAPPVEAAAPPR